MLMIAPDLQEIVCQRAAQIVVARLKESAGGQIDLASATNQAVGELREALLGYARIMEILTYAMITSKDITPLNPSESDLN